MFEKNKKKIINLALLISLPSLIFILTTGGKIISPYFTYWISEISSEIQVPWFVWLYFQNTAMLQFPLFAAPGYGIEILGQMDSTTIPMNDAIPLFAILFKMLRSIFTDTIQYFGLWIYCSFLLQFFFAKKILDLFINDKTTSFILALFFVISPVLFHRLDLEHVALFGHWAILAAIYCLLNKETKYQNWLILIIVSLLISGYIASMVLGIYIFAQIYSLFIKSEEKISHIIKLLGTVAIFFFASSVIGYDLNAGDYFVGGFGNYRFNINSFFDPAPTNWPIGSSNLGAHSWSSIMPDLKGAPLSTSGDYEGFGFLGIGVIALGIYSFFLLLKNPTTVLNKRVLPLIVLASVCLICSMSNEIMFNETEIFTYNIPSFLKQYTNSLRASGRFIWPTYYLLYIGIFVLSYRNTKKEFFKIIIISLFLIQIYDSLDMFQYVRNRFNASSTAPQVTSSLYMKADYWKEFAAKYKRVRLIPPDGIDSNVFFEVTLYAAENNMPIDSVYLPRYDRKKAEKLREKTFGDLTHDNLEGDTLYFFVYYDNSELDSRTKKSWDFLNKKRKDSDFVGEIDGFKVYAPNFFSK